MNKKVRRIKKHNSIENRRYLKEMKNIDANFKFIRYRKNAFKDIMTDMSKAMSHLYKCKPVPGKKYEDIRFNGDCYNIKWRI
jgi:hypothetical protein